MARNEGWGGRLAGWREGAAAKTGSPKKQDRRATRILAGCAELQVQVALMRRTDGHDVFFLVALLEITLASCINT